MRIKNTQISLIFIFLLIFSSATFSDSEMTKEEKRKEVIEWGCQVKGIIILCLQMTGYQCKELKGTEKPTSICTHRSPSGRISKLKIVRDIKNETTEVIALEK